VLPLNTPKHRYNPARGRKKPLHVKSFINPKTKGTTVGKKEWVLETQGALLL